MKWKMSVVLFLKRLNYVSRKPPFYVLWHLLYERKKTIRILRIMLDCTWKTKGDERMNWQTILKKDKKDMRVGRVYSSDREGKKIMMRTVEDKKIHAGAKGYGNYKGKGKNRGGGTHTNKKRRENYKKRHKCNECKGPIKTPKCLACKKLW